MRLSGALFFVITVLAINAGADGLYNFASYDPLDPRLPDHHIILLNRIQVSNGLYVSTIFEPESYKDSNPLEQNILDYLKRPASYFFSHKSANFGFDAGIKIKEDWLGIIEGDSGISNFQTAITLSGKAVIKNNIEIYQDVTFFRSDSTSYLDSASATGEYLKNPLLSYQLPGRGPIASEVNVFEIQTDRALVKTNVLGVDIATGRDRIQFKTGYRSALLFSGLTRPVDMFYRFDYDIWRFGFTALSGKLTEAGKRYISAKRATFRLAKNLRIGATEAAAYYDEPFAYINPLMLFYITHRHRPDNKDNLIASADISYTPIRNLNLYIEFLDDDLILFEGGASKYGFLFGFYKTQLFADRIDLRAEYSQVRKWTYTHVSQVNHWEYRGQPFGYWLGPDADELYGCLTCYLSPASTVNLNFNYVRKGEGDLYHPYEETGGDKTPPFPSGIAEKSTGGWIDWHHEFKRLLIRGRLGYRFIENRLNQPGDFDSYFMHWVVEYRY
jgi:hypothetical protein